MLHIDRVVFCCIVVFGMGCLFEFLEPLTLTAAKTAGEDCD
jgi:hypothetical protein